MKNIVKYIIVTFNLLFLFVIAGCYCDEVEENKFRVIYKDYDGTILREEIVEKGHKATVPENTDRYGYIFIGWDKEITNIEADTIYIAQYQRDETIPLEYVVVFIDDDGTILKEQIVKEGEDAIAPDVPYKPLVEFIGWDKDYTNVQSDLEVTAQYEEIQFEFDFDKDIIFNKVLFGRYPQSVVTDETLINALSLITEENELGYIEYNGEEYKKVVANPYGSYKFNNKEQIVANETYYFLVEPIEWLIIKQEDDTLTLLSNLILDNLAYDLHTDYRTIDGVEVSPTNYKYSNIRAWLNGYDGSSYDVEDYTDNGFIDIAFSDLEKSLLQKSLVENNCYDDVNGKDFYNVLDKIFIFYVGNTNYGVKASDQEYTYITDLYTNLYYSYYTQTFLRSPLDALCSDYTISKGCEILTDYTSYGRGYSWQRGGIKRYNDIQESNFEASICKPDNTINVFGTYRDSDNTTTNRNGIRPVLRINCPVYYDVVFKDYDGTILKEEKVKYNEDATAPSDPSRDGYMFLGWDQYFSGIYQDLEVVAEYGKIINDEYELPIYEENGYNYINVGRYPQTIVKNTSLISALSQITEENEFGYIEYNGEEYKKLNNARNSWDTWDINYPAYNNGDFILNDICYFKVEPIKWRVLEEKDGIFKLLSENVIDTIDFANFWAIYRVIDEKTIYPSNYEYSNIRAWLNGYDGTNYKIGDYTGKGFLDIAFTEEEKTFLKGNFIDNSLNSTGEPFNDYVGDNTIDKVYLLSRTDLVNPNYGFDTDYTSFDEVRKGNTTDYYRAIGGSMITATENYGTGNWWLRSPHGDCNPNDNHNHTAYIVSNGRISDEEIQEVYIGVRPAITIYMQNTTYYQVEFRDYNDNPLKVAYAKKGNNVIPPVDPYRENYTFAGWDKELTNLQSDLVTYPVYIPNTYKVTLDVNGGEPLNESVIEIAYDSIFDITPVRNGYTFLGWFNGEKEIKLGLWKQTSDLTLKAYWLDNNKSVNLLDIEGTEYIYFGKYPQTIVSDKNVIDALEQISDVNDLGYIEYNGYEYIRKEAEYSDTFNGIYFSDGTRTIEGNMYYFKVEPIKWKILKEEDGTYTLVSDVILDVRKFGKGSSGYNYTTSDIRAWLNGYDGTSYNVENYLNKGFIDIAFNQKEKECLANTTGNVLSDKIYLLSYDDMINENNGFSSDEYENDINRRAFAVDYVLTNNYELYQHLYNGLPYGNWFLRSLGGYYNDKNYYINHSGCIETYYISYSDIEYGVRPAITITIE